MELTGVEKADSSSSLRNENDAWRHHYYALRNRKDVRRNDNAHAAEWQHWGAQWKLLSHLDCRYE
jgi:hypothetical protein